VVFGSFLYFSYFMFGLIYFCIFYFMVFIIFWDFVLFVYVFVYCVFCFSLFFCVAGHNIAKQNILLLYFCFFVFHFIIFLCFWLSFSVFVLIVHVLLCCLICFVLLLFLFRRTLVWACTGPKLIIRVTLVLILCFFGSYMKLIWSSSHMNGAKKIRPPSCVKKLRSDPNSKAQSEIGDLGH